MTAALLKPDTQQIVVDEVFPHTPRQLWETLTTPALMGRWLMQPTGFEPVPGNRFTYQTTPAGEWDGVIHCEVLEAAPYERLAWSWVGGHESNAGYGSRLDTIVTWTLTPVEGGVRVRLVHAGFHATRNETAFRKMSEGWPQVVQNVAGITRETH